MSTLKSHTLNAQHSYQQHGHINFFKSKSVAEQTSFTVNYVYNLQHKDFHFSVAIICVIHQTKEEKATFQVLENLCKCYRNSTFLHISSVYEISTFP